MLKTTKLIGTVNSTTLYTVLIIAIIERSIVSANCMAVLVAIQSQLATLLRLQPSRTEPSPPGKARFTRANDRNSPSFISAS